MLDIFQSKARLAFAAVMYWFQRNTLKVHEVQWCRPYKKYVMLILRSWDGIDK